MFLVGKHEVKKPFGSPRQRVEGKDRINLAQNRGKWQAVVNTVMNHLVS
jgi:hypothetical protein